MGRSLVCPCAEQILVPSRHCANLALNTEAPPTYCLTLLVCEGQPQEHKKAGLSLIHKGMTS